MFHKIFCLDFLFFDTPVWFTGFEGIKIYLFRHMTNLFLVFFWPSSVLVTLTLLPSFHSVSDYCWYVHSVCEVLFFHGLRDWMHQVILFHSWQVNDQIDHYMCGNVCALALNVECSWVLLLLCSSYPPDPKKEFLKTTLQVKQLHVHGAPRSFF